MDNDAIFILCLLGGTAVGGFLGYMGGWIVGSASEAHAKLIADRIIRAFGSEVEKPV